RLVELDHFARPEAVEQRFIGEGCLPLPGCAGRVIEQLLCQLVQTDRVRPEIRTGIAAHALTILGDLRAGKFEIEAEPTERFVIPGSEELATIVGFQPDVPESFDEPSRI